MAERVGFEPTVALQRHAISSRAQSATLASLPGGEGGIRTHDEIAPIPVFETGALNRSATSPQIDNYSRVANSRMAQLALRPLETAPTARRTGRSSRRMRACTAPLRAPRRRPRYVGPSRPAGGARSPRRPPAARPISCRCRNRRRRTPRPMTAASRHGTRIRP